MKSQFGNSPERVRDEEAAGSNPVTPTMFSQVTGLWRSPRSTSLWQYSSKVQQ
jgi:hypothetical protein